MDTENPVGPEGVDPKVAASAKLQALEAQANKICSLEGALHLTILSVSFVCQCVDCPRGSQ